MATKSRVILNTSKFAENLKARVIAEQTKRLVEYARQTTQNIGDKIQQYQSRNHMNKMGNLLDSLCWCVSYRGKVVGFGYYQNRATSLSYLHEFSPERDAYPVGGHYLAERYIKQYGHIFEEGWRLFITIRAPYWGYWEEGFTMKRKGVPVGTRQYAVMMQYYDKVSADLKPAKVEYRNKVPQYTHDWDLFGKRMKGSLSRRYDRYSRGKFDPYSKYDRKRYRY